MSKGTTAVVIVGVVASGSLLLALLASGKGPPPSGCGPTSTTCTSALCITASTDTAVVGGTPVTLSIVGASAGAQVTFQYTEGDSAVPTNIGTTTADSFGNATYSFSPPTAGNYVVYATSGNCESGSLPITATGSGVYPSDLTLQV
jgi:hypothetical protein